MTYKVKSKKSIKAKYGTEAYHKERIKFNKKMIKKIKEANKKLKLKK